MAAGRRADERWRSIDLRATAVPGLAVITVVIVAFLWKIGGAVVDRAGPGRPVGLDLSERQLAHARTLTRAAGIDLPLLQADAEALPLAAARFDIVVCDYGAMTFADPDRTVPEVARVLRPGGLFAFNTSSPILDLCRPDDAELAGDRLVHDYFGMHQFDADDGRVSFQLPYGEWIRLFRSCGFTVLDLIEPRPASEATSSFRDDAQRAWSRRWPAECIWRLRRS